MAILFYILLNSSHGVSAFDTEFQRANELYLSGEFKKAADSYERIIEEGIIHYALFYNLGNTYYRLGFLGAAIANYERALYLQPRFSLAKHNLAVVSQKTKQKYPLPEQKGWQSTLIRPFLSLAPSTVAKSACFLWISLWGVAILHLYRPIKNFYLLGIVLGGITIISFYVTWQKFHPSLYAVTIIEKVPVYYAPEKSDIIRFELVEGDHVIIEDVKDAWVKVALNENEKGWATRSAFLRIGPPYERFDYSKLEKTPGASLE